MKFLLGAGAGAIALAGATFELDNRASNDGAPFVNPLAFAKSICGHDPAASAKRTQFFMRIARAYAQDSEVAPADVAPKRIGDIAYSVTTASNLAQAHFNQGLAQLWNFNHGAAIESFRAAQAADPQCAMCFWGEAFAYGPNINAPMEDDAVAPAFAAVKKALALRDGASEKERDLIVALGYRYQSKPVADRANLDAAFADEMDKVALKYPNDDFVLTLAAEANMDTQPWDYWMSDGRTEKGRTSRTVSLLESVLARSPDYPAAIHLYIHITEATRDPYRAAPYADRLGALTPGLGHLIHMPSHTYYRIGRYKESIDANIAAVAADEAFLAANAGSPLYEYGYYVHNVHFVMTSAQMAGDAETALAMAKKLDEKLPLQMAAAVHLAQPIKAAPYFAMAQYGDPNAVLELPDPGAEVPFLQGIWRYAKGEAYAKIGNAEKARAEAAAIAELMADPKVKALETYNIPAPNILDVARHIVIARAAAADGALDDAVPAMTEAVALQEGLNYTEPPYWYYPAKQTLAAMVLRKGDPERAEQLFIEALAEAPSNGWVLFGLSEAYKAQKDKNGAKYAASLFRDAWAGDKNAITLDRL